MDCKFLNMVVLAAIFLILYPKESEGYPRPAEYAYRKELQTVNWRRLFKRMANLDTSSVIIVGDSDLEKSPPPMDGDLGGQTFGPDPNDQLEDNNIDPKQCEDNSIPSNDRLVSKDSSLQVNLAKL